MAEVKVTKDLDNNKLIIEFDIKAPRNKVWQAFTQKDMFEKWWGPEGWVTETKEFDFRVGGRVHYGMKCVDERQGEWFGKYSWGIMDIKSIDEPDNFVYTDYFADETGQIDESMPSLLVTNQFTEIEGGTRVTGTSTADSAEQIEQLLQMGVVEGYTGQIDKLIQMLA